MRKNYKFNICQLLYFNILTHNICRIIVCTNVPNLVSNDIEIFFRDYSNKLFSKKIGIERYLKNTRLRLVFLRNLSVYIVIFTLILIFKYLFLIFLLWDFTVITTIHLYDMWLITTYYLYDRFSKY